MVWFGLFLSAGRHAGGGSDVRRLAVTLADASQQGRSHGPGTRNAPEEGPAMGEQEKGKSGMGEKGSSE